jgi:hypothetical protein
MKSVRPNFLLGVALLGSLILGWVAAAPARDLTSREEATLFSLADLGTVDLAPKTVTVEVYVAPGPELDACRRLLPLALSQVQQFYARMGVILKETPGGEPPGALAPARRLRVEVLTDKQWLARSFKAFDVAPPFRLRFLQVCLDKCAFAHLPLSTVHISFKRFQEAEAAPGERQAGPNRQWFANLLIHELGHLLGLYHSHEFTDDPVALAAKKTGTANFMSQDIAFQRSLSFVEFQKLLLQSYLSGGKVFQQYQQVNFDPLHYLELVKRANGYRETSPRKAAKISYSFNKKIKTFDDDDDDDEGD